MTNKETAEYIRKALKRQRGVFSWITDGCGYDQHIKFVQHRNDNWHGKPDEWNEFCLTYADELENKPDIRRTKCILE